MSHVADGAVGKGDREWAIYKWLKRGDVCTYLHPDMQT